MKKHFIPILLCVTAAIGVTAFLLIWNGILLLNNPSVGKFPVRGVDVSHYQGDIDWQVLSNQGIDFAFIKATEGSRYIDGKFSYNYSEARKTHLRVGAYHFFSFDSSGSAQADNFIAVVQPFEGMLPPVVDFEYYGDKQSNPPDENKTRAALDVLLSRLEEHYGVKPIIYVTKQTYDRYLAGRYDRYDIWYRDVVFSPKTLPDGKPWTFWQYTNRERLKGYEGEERFIDVNVFAGSKEEFDRYGK